MQLVVLSQYKFEGEKKEKFNKLSKYIKQKKNNNIR